MYHRPVTAAKRDPYEVLGVPRDADLEAIKSAYRRQAMRYHPDRNPGDAAAEERFKELSEAYALLRDPEARARYDRYGHPSAGGFTTPTYTAEQWREVFREADVPIDWSRVTAFGSTGNALFDALFGMVAGMLRGSGLLPGETREVRLDLTLGEAVNGATRRVRVPGPSTCALCRGTGRAALGAAAEGVAARTGPFDVATSGGVCPACGGRGVRRGTALVDVKVPKGTTSSTKLRLRGLGGPGSPPGDLLVDVEVALPPTAAVRGRDVHDRLPLLPWQAAGGARVDYEGVTVDVPPGSAAGRTLVVPGAGLGGGDLHLTVDVDLVGGALRAARGWLRKLASGGTA